MRVKEKSVPSRGENGGETVKVRMKYFRKNLKNLGRELNEAEI